MGEERRLTMRTGHVHSRALMRALGVVFAIFMLVSASSCGDAPIFIGRDATFARIDVRNENIVPLPGGGYILFPAGSITAPIKESLIVSDMVDIIISIPDEATPQDSEDEEGELVKNAYTSLYSFGPSGLKFSPAATVCFVFDADDAADAADSQIFWTNQGTGTYAPIDANPGYPAIHDEGEDDENPNDWILCGDVAHFSSGYVGDTNRDANGSDMGTGDSETFFVEGAASYNYLANDINLTGDATFMHDTSYMITVEDDGTVTLPADGGDIEFVFDEMADEFETTIFYDRVTMVRGNWELVVEQPIMPPGDLFFVLSDTDVDNTGIIWRFDSTGPTGFEGPLHTMDMGFVVEGGDYQSELTTVTDDDTLADPIYDACLADASISVDFDGTAELTVSYVGGQPQPAGAKGLLNFDVYTFDWDFDSVTGTQVPPAVVMDMDITQSVIWCDPNCGATTRDELTLEFLNEEFNLATLTQVSPSGSIDYEFDPNDTVTCTLE